MVHRDCLSGTGLHGLSLRSYAMLRWTSRPSRAPDRSVTIEQDIVYTKAGSSGAQARPGPPGRGDGSVSGGPGDSRRGLAAGEQGRRPADLARVCPARLCRGRPAVSLLSPGRVPGPGSRRESRRALGQVQRQEVPDRPRAHRCDRLFGGRPPGTDARPDGPERRARRRRLRRCSRQPGQGRRQLFRPDRPGRQGHSRYLQALGQGLPGRLAAGQARAAAKASPLDVRLQGRRAGADLPGNERPAGSLQPGDQAGRGDELGRRARPGRANLGRRARLGRSRAGAGPSTRPSVSSIAISRPSRACAQP